MSEMGIFRQSLFYNASSIFLPESKECAPYNGNITIGPHVDSKLVCMVSDRDFPRVLDWYGPSCAANVEGEEKGHAYR
jgi:hypothetical protein